MDWSKRSQRERQIYIWLVVAFELVIVAVTCGLYFKEIVVGTWILFIVGEMCSILELIVSDFKTFCGIKAVYIICAMIQSWSGFIAVVLIMLRERDDSFMENGISSGTTIAYFTLTLIHLLACACWLVTVLTTEHKKNKISKISLDGVQDDNILKGEINEQSSVDLEP